SRACREQRMATPLLSSGYATPRSRHSFPTRRSSDLRRERRRRRKVCAFCVDKIDRIDYKETGRLRRFLTERAKMLPRRITGNCARHQRQLTVAIKRARQVALLPYTTD